jgi:hypothetical protein
MSFKSADNNQRLKGTFYLSGSILYVKCWGILRLALAPVAEAGSGDVRFSEPLLDLGNVGLV